MKKRDGSGIAPGSSLVFESPLGLPLHSPSLPNAIRMCPAVEVDEGGGGRGGGVGADGGTRDRAERCRFLLGGRSSRAGRSKMSGHR
ncbi:hypothetical protein RHMOL_Rhmol12G0168900 [Rhododendron molle]|uniref:Uncharacterized protein n=1 Tax=Rhododendron molle TaxID=49168 RepID=A0ACC0LK90_RHOML|nr:hypothetical protein RHMOL_Rhmol12G0168900 [Rhododendron molle]